MIRTILLLLLTAAPQGLCGDGPTPAPSSPKTELEDSLATTPPMGWNSYDSYGTTVKESDVKANARWLSQYLKRYGWQYIVVDMEWFVSNPTPAGNGKNSLFSMDGYGRYVPAPNRFPSSVGNAGFRPLADYIHTLGLKFGIHILRGIPKTAVEKNLPIAGSAYHAADAADLTDPCPWNPDNYGLDANKPAAQAYYDSIAKLYAGWGVDFVKADCIASHPYDGGEIRMLSLALRKTGRPVVLSLSPGAAPIEKIDEFRQYSQMWRISDDVWDLWHSDVPYPQGLGDQFSRLAQWVEFSEPGHWPDADMLTLGSLRPAPGWGKPRQTQFTRDEQRTLMTLWCMFRSPLMMGGDLPANDAWTTALLTNPEVLAVDQHSTGNHVVEFAGGLVVWMANPASGEGQYLALFNTGETAREVHRDWKTLGLVGTKYKVRDLWRRKNLGKLASANVTLAPHASIIYKLSPR